MLYSAAFIVLLIVLLGAIPMLWLFTSDEPDNGTGQPLGEQRQAAPPIPDEPAPRRDAA